jgi:glutathione S-transferase
MPILTTPKASSAGGICIPESDTICRYLLSEYENVGPSFQLNNPRSNLIARIHDSYISPIQGSMYKPSPPFGSFYNRKNAIAELQRQYKVIDELVENNGSYLLGEDVSYCDATLFPTTVFVAFMLPKFGILDEDALPSKIRNWFNRVIAMDSDFAKVHDEVRTCHSPKISF